MPSLDAPITQWSGQLRATRPEFAPHLDGLADHVRSSAQDRIDAGAAVGDAFASTLGSFGAPADLSAEFDKNSTVRKGKGRMAAGTYLLITAIVGKPPLNRAPGFTKPANTVLGSDVAGGLRRSGASAPSSTRARSSSRSPPADIDEARATCTDTGMGK